MSKQIDALKLALEAFKFDDLPLTQQNVDAWDDIRSKAITAIKEALAQQSNEQKKCDNCGEFGQCCQQSNEQDTCKGCNGNGVVGNILDTVPCSFCEGSGIESQQSNEQVELAPIAWMYDWTGGDGDFHKDWLTDDKETLLDTEPTVISNVRPLFAHPPVPTAQPKKECWGCPNPEQCWEPCGELGKSEQHAKVYENLEPVAYLCEPDKNGLYGLPLTDKTCSKCFAVYRHPPVPTAQPEQDGWKMAAEYWYKEFRVAKHGEDQRNYEVRGSLDSWFEHFINPEASIKE